MSLVHGDGFDIYGTTIALMLEGIYANASDFTLPTTNPRTGTRHVRAGTVGAFLRYSVTSGNGFGVGMAVYFATLPTANQAFGLVSFRDATNTNQVSLWVTTTGAIQVRAGDHTGTVLGTTASGVLTAGAYQYVETWMRCDDIDGFVRIGVGDSSSLSYEVLNLTGIDTDTTNIDEVSSIGVFNRRTSDAPSFDIDDLAIYSNLGDANNEPFVGDSVVLVMSPDADTASADWTKSTGANGFALVDDVPPTDSAYISTTLQNAKSRFTLSNVVGSLYRVRGLVVYSRQQKSASDVSSTQVSLSNGGLFNNGTARDVTTSWHYYKDLFETDPSTSGSWTVTSLNTASIQIKKIT